LEQEIEALIAWLCAVYAVTTCRLSTFLHLYFSILSTFNII
jgi:hypothetical protein